MCGREPVLTWAAALEYTHDVLPATYHWEVELCDTLHPLTLPRALTYTQAYTHKQCPVSRAASVHAILNFFTSVDTTHKHTHTCRRRLVTCQGHEGVDVEACTGGNSVRKNRHS